MECGNDVDADRTGQIQAAKHTGREQGGGSCCSEI